VKIGFLVGAALGVGLYLFMCLVRWKKSELNSCLEAGFYGASIVTGSHLIVCAFVPSLLVEIQAANGQVVEGAEAVLGEFHTLEIFLGGVAMVYVAVRGLVIVCRKPFEKKRAH
jgi:hypothetical protein